MDHSTTSNTSSSSKHTNLASQPNSFWGVHTLDRAASMFHHLDYNLNFNPNHEEDESDERQTIHEGHKEEEEKEHMFEKPLTPSDVGKLNRLVIPKQHAEKYFPLSIDSGEKGMLLSFEDELGKSWRFRYSYWNSSQSYVLTKGWSRFVKEKRLDAGDVVWFERRRLGGGDGFFIRWRRRVIPVQDSELAHGTSASSSSWPQVIYYAHPYPSHPHVPLLYQPHSLHAEFKPVAQYENQTPPANSKRLRLFGVNLDCQLDESELPSPDDSSFSSQGRAHHVL